MNSKIVMPTIQWITRTAVIISFIATSSCSPLPTPEPPLPKATPTVFIRQPIPFKPRFTGAFYGLLNSDDVVTIHIDDEDGREVIYGTHSGNGSWEVIVTNVVASKHYVVSAEADGYTSQPISYTINTDVESNKITETTSDLDFYFTPITPLTTATPTTVGQEQLDDEERATQEAQEHQATVEAGIEDGELVDSPEELACAAEAQMVKSPSLYLLCGNDIMPALSHTPFVRAETLAEAEALLTAYVFELLGEVDPTNASVGYTSYFSDPSVLNSLTLSANGDVTLDFNDKFSERHGQQHGSTAARMLEQLNRTLFQFREVNTVSVTLNGSCEAFAQLFEFSCVNLDRETWQEMLELNSAQVEMFNLTEE